MKQVAAILLSLCLVLQCLAHVLVRGVYELNKEYVAARLCENRDKPQLNCCGKCVLGKQLNKVDENGPPAEKGAVKTIKIEVPACVLPLALQESPVPAAVIAEPIHRPGQQQLHGRLVANSVFHPPASRC